MNPYPPTTISRFELKRIETDFPGITINNSKASEEFIRQFYSDDIEVYESMFVLLLNGVNKTIGYAKISQGGIMGTVIDPLIILKYAIDSLSKKIVLAHNHPSGSKNPSSADIALTDQIQSALKLFDCELLDHIILTKDDYLSFADSELLTQ